MSSAQLERQARVLAQYLTGTKAPDSVVRKYLDYHRMHDRAEIGFDRFLLAISTRGPILTAIADSYCCHFRKSAVLRKKLVLLLALLECTGESSRRLDTADGTSGLRLWAMLAWRGTVHIAALAASLILVLPFHLWSVVRDSG